MLNFPKLSRRQILKGGTAVAALSASTLALNTNISFAALAADDEFADLPLLDQLQSGHLRHIRNSLWLPDTEWGNMSSLDASHSGDFTGLQYQISSMSRAMGQTHLHHLPAAPGFFKADMNQAVKKMLHPDVWNYWFAMSQGSSRWNPDLKEPQQPWWNPVVKENIMYSGHLNPVAELYAYMFNDDKYDKPGSLRFDAIQMNPWGERTVSYSLPDLHKLIYDQAVANDYIGVACMPNTVFVTSFPFGR